MLLLNPLFQGSVLSDFRECDLACCQLRAHMKGSVDALLQIWEKAFVPVCSCLTSVIGEGG